MLYTLIMTVSLQACLYLFVTTYNLQHIDYNVIENIYTRNRTYSFSLCSVRVFLLVFVLYLLMVFCYTRTRFRTRDILKKLVYFQLAYLSYLVLGGFKFDLFLRVLFEFSLLKCQPLLLSTNWLRVLNI